MRVVLDTNVVVSGVFFGGVPGKILSAWSAGATQACQEAPWLGLHAVEDVRGIQ